MPGSYNLREDQQMGRTMAGKMAKDRLAPRAAEIDKVGEFPWDIIDFYRENHILDLPIPAEYGGQGADALSCHLVIEEFATECANSAHALADHWLGMHPLELGGNEEQKKRFFPELKTKLIAFSLTESEAGSDVGNMKTRAVLKGDNYVLNGTKCFCTDGNVADYITIFAKTDSNAGTRGISAFIVPRFSPGLAIGRGEDQMGMRGTRAVEIILEDCEVPAANRLGKEGDGFNIAMHTFDFSRPLDGILAIGIAQGAYNYAKQYALQRKQFGQPISDFQAIQFILADMAMNIEAGRHLTYRAG